MEQKKTLIYDLDYPDLRTALEELGQPGYRTDQVWKAVYKNLVSSPGEITTLPKAIRERLSDSYSFNAVTPKRTLESSDGRTIKTLFSLWDGKPIEAVLMFYNKRRTLCISSQSGCPVGCTFCATGQMGFHRNLSDGEIIAQVLYYARYLASRQESISNIVVMGMGEPFMNYQSVIAALDRMNDPLGLGLGARRFTMSTVGIVPEILRFAKDRRQYNLAISLHTVDDELRSRLIPINNKYPVNQILSACREYTNVTKRRITFEYALIDGINDTVTDARSLAVKIRGMLCHVNLIPLNPTASFPGKPTGKNQVGSFFDVLNNANIPCTIRLRRGIEIAAGCGQLAAESWDNQVIQE